MRQGAANTAAEQARTTVQREAGASTEQTRLSLAPGLYTGAKGGLTMQPKDAHAILVGLRYDTKTATLLAGDDYYVGNANFE